MSKIGIGDIVVSTQGRDLGVYYVVIGELSDDYYILVNGDGKKFSNPKRKIKKHIDKTGKTIDNIKIKLETNIKVFDSEVYSALKRYKEELLNQENLSK